MNGRSPQDGTSRPAPAPRGLSSRTRQGLTSLAPEDGAEPFAPPGRLAAPPPNVPPVFDPTGTRTGARPVPAQRSAVPPPGLAAPASPDTAAAAPPAPRRPVPAFTAHVPAPRAGTTPLGDGALLAPPAPGPAATRLLTAPAPPATDLSLGRRARRRPGRAATVSAVLAVLVLAVTAAAVAAVPSWLDRRDRQTWATTRLTLPAKVDGLSRVVTGSASTAERSAQAHVTASGAGQLITDLGVYAAEGRARVVVVLGRPQAPLDEAERTLVRSGYAGAVEQAGVVLTPRDPGPLGGWFGCGVRDGRTTTCLSVDAGAVVSVSVSATGPAAVRLARRVRAAVTLRG